MKINKSKYAAALLFALLPLLIFGCHKNNTETKAGEITKSTQTPQQKTAVKIKHLNSSNREYIKDKTIAVFLGHGFNDEETVSRFSRLLNLNYGLNTPDSQGLIKVLVYPDDFMVGGKARLSSLYHKLEDDRLAGLITFGAPEGLCDVIARLEDLSIKKQQELLDALKKEEETKDALSSSQSSQESTPPIEEKVLARTYPVFSYFQQDDSLGSESTADFVLDYTPKTSELDNERSDSIPDFDSTLLLMNSVDQMINLRAPLSQDKNLLNFVQKLVGKQKTVSYYNDYETGLKSINHFIFE